MSVNGYMYWMQAAPFYSNCDSTPIVVVGFSSDSNGDYAVSSNDNYATTGD